MTDRINPDDPASTVGRCKRCETTDWTANLLRSGCGQCGSRDFQTFREYYEDRERRYGA